MSRVHMRTERILSRLEELYRDVDRAAESLGGIHGGRFTCREGCSMCCVDGITVFELEALSIEKNCARTIDSHLPHPPVACAFLSAEGSCLIYPFHPCVCRTQGLPLRWIDEEQGHQPVEMRDICPFSDAGTPVEELLAGACWSIGPFEDRLAGLQLEAFPGRMKRVRLRGLFSREGRKNPPAGNAGRSEDKNAHRCKNTKHDSPVPAQRDHRAPHLPEDRRFHETGKKPGDHRTDRRGRA